MKDTFQSQIQNSVQSGNPQIVRFERTVNKECAWGKGTATNPSQIEDTKIPLRRIEMAEHSGGIDQRERKKRKRGMDLNI